MNTMINTKNKIKKDYELKMQPVKILNETLQSIITNDETLEEINLFIPNKQKYILLTSVDSKGQCYKLKNKSIFMRIENYNLLKNKKRLIENEIYENKIYKNANSENEIIVIVYYNMELSNAYKLFLEHDYINADIKLLDCNEQRWKCY